MKIHQKSIIVLLAAAMLSAPAMAEQVCASPDASFGKFLVRFKNDKAFRESRLVLPLQTTLTDPESTSKESLSLRQIRERQMRIIIGDADARELKGTEGQLCETPAIVNKNRAQYGQHSCETDVYEKVFYFVRKDGCWMLKQVHASGG